ncbi:hypothetical protein [Fibrobacter sp.]|uniref:hypothetical protein n=1 Tax=Fibrobacter sp. TaxID=35828 RepID=UPI00388EAAC9
MILFSILAVMLVLFVGALLIGGVGLALTLGDFIICGLLIYGLFKLFSKKEKKKS